MRIIYADDFFRTFPELDIEPYNNFPTVENERPQVVIFAENITEEEKQKLIAEIKSVMDNAKFTAEPERQKGEWHHYTRTLNFNTFYITECPYCGLRVKEETNFCPNCGADMRPKKEEGTE